MGHESTLAFTKAERGNDVDQTACAMADAETGDNGADDVRASLHQHHAAADSCADRTNLRIETLSSYQLNRTAMRPP